jgi:hypothetical protein
MFDRKAAKKRIYIQPHSGKGRASDSMAYCEKWTGRGSEHPNLRVRIDLPRRRSGTLDEL